MCQLNAVMEREGKQETLMEGVTGLEVTPQGIILRTYFEEPMTIAHASIKRIDFLGGSVVLSPDLPDGA
ncbi:MAG: CooT family nickel-binding protein [Candidatus Electrothrix sp. AUS4]|nr:CooT family nickel-binding protein [Candidatus Electrothrix sp. AUS4]